MQLHQLKRTQWLPITPDIAWAFFSNPANLPAITPDWLSFTVTSDLPHGMYPGMIATYTLQVPYITWFDWQKIPWVTEITHVREPEYFVDEQRFGPYQFWHHQHHFTPLKGAKGEEGIEMTDIVHYALPVGTFGQWAHTLFVRRQLEEIFDYRARQLEDFFGGDA